MTWVIVAIVVVVLLLLVAFVIARGRRPNADQQRVEARARLAEASRHEDAAAGAKRTAAERREIAAREQETAREHTRRAKEAEAQLCGQRPKRGSVARRPPHRRSSLARSTPTGDRSLRAPLRTCQRGPLVECERHGSARSELGRAVSDASQALDRRCLFSTLSVALSMAEDEQRRVEARDRSEVARADELHARALDALADVIQQLR
jgi:hypothetical protein